MTREVVLTETAQQQMSTAADWYAEQNPTVAAKWFNGLIHHLNALADNPEQYFVARESEFLPVAAATDAVRIRQPDYSPNSVRHSGTANCGLSDPARLNAGHHRRRSVTEHVLIARSHSGRPPAPDVFVSDSIFAKKKDLKLIAPGP